MNAEPYQPKVGDTVWIARENFHDSGTVTEISETTSGPLYYVDSAGSEYPTCKVYADEAGALRALLKDLNLSVSMANLRLTELESQAAQPQPIAA